MLNNMSRMLTLKMKKTQINKMKRKKTKLGMYKNKRKSARGVQEMIKDVLSN